MSQQAQSLDNSEHARLSTASSETLDTVAYSSTYSLNNQAKSDLML